MTGRDSNFEIVHLPPALDNKGTLVKVPRSSKKARKIGLIREKSCDADKYLTYGGDAYGLMEGRVKQVEIEPGKAGGRRRVMVTMVGGERQELVREKKTYREADKNFYYKMTGKAVKQPSLTEADLTILEANTRLSRQEIEVTL